MRGRISRRMILATVLATLLVGVVVGVVLGVVLTRKGEAEIATPPKKPTDVPNRDEGEYNNGGGDGPLGSSITRLGQDLYPLNADLDYFGSVLALSANGTILAAGGGGPGFDDYGQVRVFGYDGDRWIPMGQPITAEKAGTSLDQRDFGYEVALSASGTTLAIRQGNEETTLGGESNSSSLPGRGIVVVFEYDLVRGEWLQLGNELRGRFSDDRFGAALSLSEDGRTLAVGAFNGGYSQVFQFNNTHWNQIGQILEENFGYPIDFGMSVALSVDGSIVAVGGPTNDPTGGMVYVYEYQYENNTWVQLGESLQGQGVFDFGVSIALSANGYTVAGVGESSCMMGGTCHVRLFRYNPRSQSWVELANTLAGFDPKNVVAISKDGTILALRGSDFVALFRKQAGNTSSWQLIDSGIENDSSEIAFGHSLALSYDGTVIAVGSPWSASPVRVYSVLATND